MKWVCKCLNGTASEKAPLLESRLQTALLPRYRSESMAPVQQENTIELGEKHQASTGGGITLSMGSFSERAAKSFENSYELVQEDIGEGTIGAVHKVINRKTRQAYAAKTIVYEEVCGAMKQEMINEIAILKTLSHPNIIKVGQAAPCLSPRAPRPALRTPHTA